MSALDKKLYFDQEKYSIVEKGDSSLFLSSELFTWLKTSITGMDVLYKMDGENPLYEIIQELAIEYDIPVEVIQDDIDHFCKHALKRGIIQDHSVEEVYPETPTFDEKLHSLYIDITNQCNLDCIYCNKQTSSCKDEPIYLQSAQITEYMSQLLSHYQDSVPLVNLTGGEPLLCGNLEEIIIALKAFDCRLVLWTNGILLDHETAAMLKEHCDYIMISLDGHDKKSNDSIRGTGAFEGAARAVEICREIGLPYIIASTPTVHNVSNLDKILTFAHNNGASGFMLNEPVHMAIDGTDLSKNFDYPLSQLKSMFRYLGKRTAIINSWKNNRLKMELSSAPQLAFFNDSKRCMNSIFAVRPKQGCGAGVNELSLDATGQIYPCHALHIQGLSLGTPADFTKKNIVLTKELESCSECNFNLFCLGGCRAQAFYHSNKISGEFPFCEYERSNYEEILWSPLQPIRNEY